MLAFRRFFYILMSFGAKTYIFHMSFGYIHPVVAALKKSTDFGFVLLPYTSDDNDLPKVVQVRWNILTIVGSM